MFYIFNRHTGNILSKHRTLQAAEKAAKKAQPTGKGIGNDHHYLALTIYEADPKEMKVVFHRSEWEFIGGQVAA